MEEDWDAETNNQPGVTFSLTTEQVLGWQQTLEDVEDCFNYKPEVYGSIINTKSSDNSITENVITSEEDEQQDTCTYKGKELNTHSRKIQYVPHKIFVGNIDFRAKKKEVVNFFQQFGNVKDIHFPTNHKTRRRKGTAFIEYEDEESVQKVLNTDESEFVLDGRQLRIFPAEEKQRAATIRSLRACLDEQHQDEHPLTSDPGDHARVDIGKVENALSKNTIASEDVGRDSSNSASDNGSSAVNTLTDDTLMHIFEMLPVQDRIRIERVCQRWRSLSRKTWHSLQHLDFKGIFFGFNKLTDGIFLSLVKRGCQSLKSIDLSASPHYLTDWCLELLSSKCCQLTKVDFSGVHVTNAALKNFTEKCRGLQWIKLENCHDVGEKGLWYLFHHCKDIQYVNLTNNKRLTGQCFHMMMDSSVNTLILNDCTMLQDVGLQKLVRCPHLHEIQLNNCVTLTDRGLEELVQGCPELSVVWFDYAYLSSGITQDGLSNFSRLALLEELHLCCMGCVTNQVLQALGEGCKKLRYLDIGLQAKVTDEGLVCLTACQDLHTLKMQTDNTAISDSSLTLLADSCALRIVVIRGTSGITDTGSAYLAQNCSGLEWLDLRGNTQITNTTIQAFLNAESDGLLVLGKQSLTLLMGGTSVVLDSLNSESLSTANIIIDVEDPVASMFASGTDLYLKMHSSDEEGDFQEEDLDDGDLCPGAVDLDAEAFLDADDPSMLDDFELS